METDDSVSGLLPEHQAPGPLGQQAAPPAANTADADAEIHSFAAGLYGNGGTAPNTADGTISQEGSIRKKRQTKKSSRTILSDCLQTARINSRSGNGSEAETGRPDTIEDEVFVQSVPSGDSGMETGAVDNAAFPSEYNIIRTARAAALAPARMAGLFGLGRVPTGTRLGYGTGGLAVEGDCRTFLAQNYHCAEKGLNMSFSLARPDRAGRDGLICLACPARHSHADRMAGEGRPVVVILADQNFPAILPVSSGDCAIVVRIEDGTLADLDAAFTDRFRAFLKPHGSLTPGSVVLYGSLSHLRACGIQEYAEGLVKTYVSLAAKVGGGVDVVPLVPVPMHGMESGSLIRDLMDMDAWLLTLQGGGARSSPEPGRIFGQSLRTEYRAARALLNLTH